MLLNSLSEVTGEDQADAESVAVCGRMRSGYNKQTTLSAVRLDVSCWLFIRGA